MNSRSLLAEPLAARASALAQRAAVVFCLLLYCSSAPAEDLAAVGDDAAADAIGFEAPDPAAGEATTPPGSTLAPIWFEALLQSNAGIWPTRLSSQPIARLRQAAELTLAGEHEQLAFRLSGYAEIDLGYLGSAIRTAPPEREVYASQLALREAWARWDPSPWHFSFGRQHLAWGEGIALGLLDALSPRDLREPGISSLESIRLPVLSSRLVFERAGHVLELTLIHEGFYGYRPSPLGNYSPLPSLIAGDRGLIEYREHLDDRELRFRDRSTGVRWDTQQPALRYRYRGPVDLAVYAAAPLDQIGTFRLPAPSSAVGAGPLNIDIHHGRYLLLGQSGALSRGAFALRWELALELARAVNVAVPRNLLTISERTSHFAGALLGLRHAGFARTVLDLELAQRLPLTPLESPLGLVPIQDRLAVVAGLLHSASGDDLQLQLAGGLFGLTAELGGWLRAEVRYRLHASLQLALGGIVFKGADEFSILSGYGNNHQLFGKLQWSFVGR